MTGMSDAYRRAMAKKGADKKKLRDADRAFGSQSARLMALYGNGENYVMGSGSDNEDRKERKNSSGKKSENNGSR